MQLINGQHLVVKVHKCTPPASLSQYILKVCGSCRSTMTWQDVTCSLQTHMQRRQLATGPHKKCTQRHHLKCLGQACSALFSYTDSQQLQVKLPKLFVLLIWDPSLVVTIPNACAQRCTAVY